MRKLLALLTCLVVLPFAAQADEKPIPYEQLPVEAKNFVKQHFPNVQVAYAQVESGWFDKKYEAGFANGDKLEFDDKGRWTDIDCKRSQVPQAVIPQQIRTYIGQNYSGQTVRKIERDSKGYEVELGNDFDLKFDLKFNLIKID